MKSIYKTICLFVVLLLIITPLTYTQAQQIREERNVRENSSIRELKTNRISRTERFKQDEVLVKYEGEKRVRRIPTTQNESVAQAVRRFSELKDVVYAEPNYIAYASYVPNDTYYPIQWNLDNPTSGGINLEKAWDISNGSGVVVAILDTGVAYETYRQNWWNRYYQAPDLANTNFVQGYDFVNNDTHPNDDQGHGTHVAGTIAQSSNNSLGTAGIAFGASIMPVKILNSRGSGTYGDIADGIRYAADNGADVINMSLGGPSDSVTLREAVKYAYNKGVTIIVAAGNDGKNSVSYPAAYNQYVIAVGATRFDETLTSYSNYGADIDVVAPGGDTGVDQNGDGYSDGILQQTFGSRYNDWGYYFYQGTSMATPHVVGVAALLVANGTANTPDEVRQALEETAKDLGTNGFDTTYGNGLIDAYAALQWNTGPVDNPPTVTLTQPVDTTLISGEITVSADASDDIEVTEVAFYLDNTLLFTDTTSPYTFQWDSTTSSDGAYTLKSIAKDSISQTSESLVNVTIENVNQQPVITSTANLNAIANTQYTYQVTASDPDPTDSVTFSLSTTSPVGMSIDATNGMIMWTPTDTQVGSHTISVRVIDTGGLTDIQNFTMEVTAEPEIPLEEIVFTDSFENGLTNWTQDSQRDWRTSSQRSVDGKKSAEIDGRARKATITSIPIDLNGHISATISFSWFIERRVDRNEYIFFSISTDSGSTWVEKARLRGNVDKEDVWANESIELTGITNLQLRFGGTMSRSNEDADVDMVSVLGQ